MTEGGDFEIFLVTAPGLESALCAEARAARLRASQIIPVPAEDNVLRASFGSIAVG